MVLGVFTPNCNNGATNHTSDIFPRPKCVICIAFALSYFSFDTAKGDMEKNKSKWYLHLGQVAFIGSGPVLVLHI